MCECGMFRKTAEQRVRLDECLAAEREANGEK
jgi:hypothetical protein